MWNRKKFLIFAVFLNCIYFVGTSILVTRHVSNHNNSHMLLWVKSSSRAVVDKIILDIHHRNAIANEFKQLDFVNEIRDWASINNITNVVQLEEKITRNWVGSREKIPFNKTQLKSMEDVGFYKNENYLNFNYFLKANEKRFFITQQFDDIELLLYLDAYGMQMTIVESEGENTGLVLYSTLPKMTANELLQKTPLNKTQTTPERVTLAKETYIMQMVDLISHAPLRQKILFTKKVRSYELVSKIDILIYIWTFFCISIVLNIALFKFTRVDANLN
jgi:hypothetical protein